MAKRKQSQRDIILNHFKLGDQNALGLSLQQNVGFPISTVHKRINDLYNDGLVDQTGYYIQSRQNETYAIYRLVPESKRYSVIRKRDNDRNLKNLRVRFNNGWMTKERYESDLYELTEKMNRYESK